MASDIRGIVGAVKTALAGINATGSYVHNLSATGRVRIGRPTLGDGTAPPSAWVAIGRLDSGQAPQLGRFRRDLVLDIEARAPATTLDTEERELIGSDLLDDICTAIEADRTLGSRVLDVIVTGASFDGDEAGIPGCAVVLAQVSCYYHKNSGAGV